MHVIFNRIWAHKKVLGFYLVLLLGGWFMGDRLREFSDPELQPLNAAMIQKVIIFLTLLFIVTSALPFVPGAEIGFGLLMVFGAPAAPLVYGGMVGALVLSFGCARLFPPRSIARALAWLGLARAAQMIAVLDAVPAPDRVALLTRNAPGRLAGLAMRHRYLMLVVLLNVPGNSLIGGGGGIAFIAGLSGVFTFWKFLGAIALAVIPVPLGFFLF